MWRIFCLVDDQTQISWQTKRYLSCSNKLMTCRDNAIWSNIKLYLRKSSTLFFKQVEDRVDPWPIHRLFLSSFIKLIIFKNVKKQINTIVCYVVCLTKQSILGIVYSIIESLLKRLMKMERFYKLGLNERTKISICLAPVGAKHWKEDERLSQAINVLYKVITYVCFTYLFPRT